MSGVPVRGCKPLGCQLRILTKNLGLCCPTSSKLQEELNAQSMA